MVNKSDTKQRGGRHHLKQIFSRQKTPRLFSQPVRSVGMVQLLRPTGSCKRNIPDISKFWEALASLYPRKRKTGHIFVIHYLFVKRLLKTWHIKQLLMRNLQIRAYYNISLILKGNLTLVVHTPFQNRAKTCSQSQASQIFFKSKLFKFTRCWLRSNARSNVWVFYYSQAVVIGREPSS